MRFILGGAAALLLLSACGSREQAGSDTAGSGDEARAAHAAMIADAIEANPVAADSILRAAGYTAVTFERLMYEIARDSVMSAVYTSAKGR